MRKLTWYARQLLPLTYQSHYKNDRQQRFAVWKMWFGKVYDCEDVAVK